MESKRPIASYALSALTANTARTDSPMPPLASRERQQQPQDRRSRGRSKRRQLFCPAHPEQRVYGQGPQYFLHLLKAEELRQRGMADKKARLVIQAYPVLVLRNEWLEELFCPECGQSHWCHIVKHDASTYTVRWAPRELWQQVAHVDPLVPNPSVSQFSRHAARRRSDRRRLFDPGC